MLYGSKLWRLISCPVTGWIAVALAAVVLPGMPGFGSAFAAPLEFEFTQFTGKDSRMHVSVEQAGLDLRFTISSNVNLQGRETAGEIRALYFSVADKSLLRGLTFSGDDISIIKGKYHRPDRQGVNVDAGRVHKVISSDTNINGAGNKYRFDAGIEFGNKAGIDLGSIAGIDLGNIAGVGLGSQGSNNGLYSTLFTVSHSGGLSLDDFFATSGNIFGGRLKPFSNGGSSKLACSGGACGYNASSGSSGGDGSSRIPEPASLAVLGAGLVMLAVTRRRRRLP